MNTQESPQETKKTRKPRKKKRFIVTLAGVPCVKVNDKRFGLKLIPAGGTLVPMASRAPEVFPGYLSANRAAGRAIRLRKRLTEAVCDVGPQYAAYMRPGDFAVIPVPPEEAS